MPVTFRMFIERLEEISVFQTLGNRSSFQVTNLNGHITITNSRGNVFELDDTHVSSVSNRYLELFNRNRHLITSEYTDPNWEDVPNRIFSPYIAKIVSILA
jgi:hypothetical protein